MTDQPEPQWAITAARAAGAADRRIGGAEAREDGRAHRRGQMHGARVVRDEGVDLREGGRQRGQGGHARAADEGHAGGREDAVLERLHLLRADHEDVDAVLTQTPDERGVPRLGPALGHAVGPAGLERHEACARAPGGVGAEARVLPLDLLGARRVAPAAGGCREAERPEQGAEVVEAVGEAEGLPAADGMGAAQKKLAKDGYKGEVFNVTYPCAYDWLKASAACQFTAHIRL